MMMFDGWPADALALLGEIAADNRADLWPELRDRHTAAVRGPTLALAAALEAEFGPVRVLRPHVSRRFRPDAPPLRTDAGGVAASAGGCGLAFLLSPSDLAVTAGHWRFDRGQLLRYRAAVAGEEAGVATWAEAGAAATPMPATPPPGLASPGLASPGLASPGLASPGLGSSDLAEAAAASQSPGTPRSVSPVCEGRPATDAGAELEVVLERLAADGLIPDSEGELRGTPRGWRRDHPRIALARRRGLQVVRRWELGAWISTPEPLERIRTAWHAAAPLVEWLDTHVGAPAADPPPARERPTSDSPP